MGRLCSRHVKRLCKPEQNFTWQSGLKVDRDYACKDKKGVVHDAFYQFMPEGLPPRRVQVDCCFLRLMNETGFRPRYVYYAMVVLCGWAF